MNNIITREFQESDRGYICRTILFGMIELDKATRRINRDSFLTCHNKIINAILNMSRCLVVADQEEPGLIYGFIIYQQEMGDYDILHYAYTRKDFRGLGLLKNLVPIIQTKRNLALTCVNDFIQPAKLKEFYDKVIIDPYPIYKL